MGIEHRRSLVDKIFHRESLERTTSQHSKIRTGTTTALSTDSLVNETTTLTLPLTGGGIETLIIPNDHYPRNPYNDVPEQWNFHRGTRRASVAASDVGEKISHTSDVEKAEFVLLMKDTKGMSAEQVKRYLDSRGSLDGGKIMGGAQHGSLGDGYMQVTGARGGVV